MSTFVAPLGPLLTCYSRCSSETVTSVSSDTQTGDRQLDGAMDAINRASHAFKSQAQRRKFAQLLVEGKISNETFEEWNRETGRKKLPERVGVKAKSSKTTTRRRTAAAKSAKKR
jgi:hypothetical protein